MPRLSKHTFYFSSRIIFLVHLSTVLIFTLDAQESHQKSISSTFYPLNAGDYWEYFDVFWWNEYTIQDTASVLVEKDSLLYGRMYRKIRSHSFRWKYFGTSYFRIDSIGDVYSLDTASGNEGLLYRLSDTSKSVWFTGQMKARFDSTAIRNIFGSPRRVLMISYFGRDDTTYRRSLLWESLAEGIGRVTYGNEYSGYGIKGCCISGVTYGTITSVEHTPSPVPASFALHHNYPNPFNPSTTISYELPGRSFVTLRIFNVLGQGVATLVNREVGLGKHQVQWDAAGLPSGVYFYRLDAEGYIMSRKMILTK